FILNKEVKMAEPLKPLPIPEGMTNEEIDAMRVNEGEWRKSFNFVCCTCGQPAYLHPYTNVIWGCKKCGYTTYATGIYFRAVH
ncbi:MAG: hypothetical protein ACOZAL_03525, partial [Patescibacteria group bacterium]